MTWKTSSTTTKESTFGFFKMDLELVYRSYRTERERIHAWWLKQGITVCPRCGGGRFKPKKTKPRKYFCQDCLKEFNALKGSIYVGSRYPLATWYTLIKLIQAEPGLDSMAMGRRIGVSGDSIRLLRKKILYAIENEDKN